MKPKRKQRQAAEVHSPSSEVPVEESIPTPDGKKMKPKRKQRQAAEVHSPSSELVLLLYEVAAVLNKVNAAKSRVTTAVRVSTAR
nr:hypothetical protein [Tanacetum cinerariifolium]